MIQRLHDYVIAYLRVFSWVVWCNHMQLQGVMHVFGRISFLVDENTQAIHFFITALLQLMDRGGFLYAELARFVFRLLGYKPEVSVLREPCNLIRLVTGLWIAFS